MKYGRIQYQNIGRPSDVQKKTQHYTVSIKITHFKTLTILRKSMSDSILA